MSRTEKFVLNSFSAAILQIITMLAGLITPRIMLVVYGSEINGLITSISQFISYFNLVEAGLAASVVYALYKPLAEQNHSKINSIVTAAKNFYFQSGYIFLILVVSLALLYPVFVKSDLLTEKEIGVLVLILGVSGALEFFTLAKYRAILTADQKTYIISFTSCLVTILNTAIIVILGFMRVNVVIMRMAVLSTVFLRSIILYVYVNKKYKYLDFSAEPDKSALNKRWEALYQQLLGSIQNGGPVIIATFLTSLSQVSIYSVYSMVLSGINGIMSIFTSGLAASFGEIIVTNNRSVLKKAYSQFEYCYYMMITIVYAMCLVLIYDFIKIYTANITDANYCVPLYGVLFTLNGLMYNIKTPQGMLIISAGMYRETRWRSTIQALLIVVVGVILTPCWKICGVLAGLLASNLYRTIDLLIFVPKYITHIPKRYTIRRMIRIFINVYIVFFVNKLFGFEVNSYMGWIIKAVITGIYTVLIVVLINGFIEKTLFKEVCARVKGMVKNVNKTGRKERV